MRARSWVLPLLLVSPLLACERGSARRPPVATEPIVHATTVPIAPAPAAAGEPEPEPGGAVVGSGPTNLWRDSGVSAAPVATPPQDGPSPVPFAVDVRLATDVALYDTWNGMGPTHTVVVALHKSGAFFTYDAKVSARPYSVGEPLPDPRLSPGSHGGCRCALTAVCPCETDAGATREQGRVPAAVVGELLTAFGTRPLDLRQSHPPVGRSSDNYPYLHFVVTVPGASPVHFTAPDHRRHWTRDGMFLYRLPDEATNGNDIEHSFLNGAFGKLESTLGVGRWLRERRKLDPNGGAL